MGDKPLSLRNSLDNLTQLYSDALTGFSVHRFVHLAARSTKVYYYRFSYQGQRSHITYPENAPYGNILKENWVEVYFLGPSLNEKEKYIVLSKKKKDSFLSSFNGTLVP